MANDLERIYPGSVYMQERARQLRALGNEWLSTVAEQVAANVQHGLAIRRR